MEDAKPVDYKPEPQVSSDGIYIACEKLYLALDELTGEKEKGGRSERARYVAIAITDLEKLIAFMKVYLLDQ